MSAQYRITAEPSIEVSEVSDSNLFYSAENPTQDVIERVRPALALQFESPRWLANGMYGFDSDHFATHSSLTNARARQRALIDVRYQSSPRLIFSMVSNYMDTDTPADLNLQTGLASVRVRAQQLTFHPSASYQISPRLSVRASYLSTIGQLAGGPGMRAQFQTVGLEQQMSPRDGVTLNLEQGLYTFDLKGTTTRTDTYALRAGWRRDLGTRTHVELEAGPRVTDGSLAPELSAAVTQTWKSSSIAISAQQTQTTAIGFVGTVEARNLQARFAYAPTGMFTAYVAPAVFRTIYRDVEATVYRIGLGARYALTPLVGLDVMYSLDSQHGAIVPSQANAKFSHSVLSGGLTARWNGRDWLK